MREESLPGMPFPCPSSTLLKQAGADAPSGQLRTWMHALPKTIQHYLSQWRAEWTGESLKQGYLGYVAVSMPRRHRCNSQAQPGRARSGGTGDRVVSLVGRW